MVKTCLATAISHKLFTFKEFTTVAKEVEESINDQRLICQFADSGDTPPTSPHLIRGRDVLLFPPLHCPPADADGLIDLKQLCRHYFLLSNTLQQFYWKWHVECFTSLHERYCNICAASNIHHLVLGLLIMVKSADLPRLEWMLGMVVKIFRDDSGAL